MARSLLALRALVPCALLALAGEVDRAVGLLLHASVGPDHFVRVSLGLLDPRALISRVALWVAAGAALWAFLAWLEGRGGLGFLKALQGRSGLFAPLYLKPALTVLALLALGLHSKYPYAATLPVALTQDLALGVDLALLGAVLAACARGFSLPAPGAGGVFFVAFLAYALLSPGEAREWAGHPGNEPKYLRMAVALGDGLSLDVDQVSAVEDQARPIESLTPRPLPAALSGAVSTLVGESWRMFRALLEGPRAVGTEAIRATRLARQTVRGKQGGTYHVLAPGPSVFLAPFLRLDRSLNLRFGRPGRLGVTLLAWNALAAALVAVLFLLLRDVTGRGGLAALLAGGFALAPPYLFYCFQFYPEVPGALLLALCLRLLLFKPRWTTSTLALLGGALALLPWLHQKFLPVWFVLVVIAVGMAGDRLVTLRGLLWLLLPQGVTLYLTALYNFAITGSVRPDALFRAWGPGGVSAERVGEGALGLLLDARYGLLPYAPLYLLSASGLLMAGPAARHLRLALPAIACYHLTVAAADNWSGSVCNLGRYIMPATPLLAALVAVALEGTRLREGVLALALVLGAWTGLLTLALWQDPRAANDSALLLEKSVFADGNVYIPNLFFRSWNYGAPGHAARVAAWLVLLLLGGMWLVRVARGRGGRSSLGTLAGVLALLLVAGSCLERWPSPRRAPRFGNSLRLRRGAIAYLSGSVEVQGALGRARSGEVEVLVSSRDPLESLTLTASGVGVVRVSGSAPLLLHPGGARVSLPLAVLRRLRSPDGTEEILYRERLSIESVGDVILGLDARDGD